MRVQDVTLRMEGQSEPLPRPTRAPPSHSDLNRRSLIGAAMMEMSETGFFPQSVPIKFPRVPLWGKNPICIICIIRPFLELACKERKSTGYESKRASSAFSRTSRTTCKNRKHELRERCIKQAGAAVRHGCEERIKAGSVGHERTGGIFNPAPAEVEHTRSCAPPTRTAPASGYLSWSAAVLASRRVSNLWRIFSIWAR